MIKQKMKKVLSLFILSLIVIISVFGCKQAETATEVSMQKISIEDAHEKLGDSNWIFLNSRKVADYETNHIEGAISIDMESVLENKGEAKARIAEKIFLLLIITI